MEKWVGDAGRGRGRGPPGPTPPRWGPPGPERHQHPDRWGGPIGPEVRPREARDKWEKWGPVEGKQTVVVLLSCLGKSCSIIELGMDVGVTQRMLTCSVCSQEVPKSPTCLMMTNGVLHMVGSCLPQFPATGTTAKHYE